MRPDSPSTRSGLPCVRLAATALALTATAWTATAQADWRLVDAPQNRIGHAMAYDGSSGKVIMFGGHAQLPFFRPWWESYTFGTWLWDGTTWRRGGAGPVPSPREGHRLLEDRQRNRVLLAGGVVLDLQRPPTVLTDVWEWRNGAWNQLSPTGTAPAPRLQSNALAYDSARDRIVAFGGCSTRFCGIGDETWEWDGAGWVRRTPALSPPQRRDAAMAYDPVRGRTVLFGGETAAFGTLADTWEWDGTAWQQIVTPNSPPARAGHEMIFDPRTGGILLLGGSDARQARTDLWTYLGSRWVQLAAAGAPARRQGGAALDPVRGRLVWMGGEDPDGRLRSDTWEWDGTQWLQRASDAIPPCEGNTGVMVTHWARGSLLMWPWWSGPVSLWERSGGTWNELPIAGTPPPARNLGSMAFDPLRSRLVLFGGTTSSNGLGDTWEWDGTSWSQAAPASSPPGRFGASMAADPVAGGLLLFGGHPSSSQVQTSDTWRWDGTTWTLLQPTVSPPARAWAAMATDPVNGRIVLVGGFDTSQNTLQDHWEWDGAQWAQRVPAPPLQVPTLAFDATRGVVAMCGRNPQGWYETWDWDGQSWTRQPVSAAPAIDPETRLSWGYDPAAGQNVLVDPFAAGGTFEFGRVQVRATLAWIPNTCTAPLASSLQLLAHPLYLGESTVVSVYNWNLFTPQPVFAWGGASNTSWAGGALPFDLTPFGLSGCQLLARPAAMNFLGFTSAGVAPPWTVAACNCPNLAGLNVYFQALMFTPGANPAGALTTNAIELHLGLR